MKKASIEYWPPDVLRHSFASAHYAAYKNPAHTALLLGHRDENMLLTHYRDLMKPNDAARYWTIAPRIAANNILPMASACEGRGGPGVKPTRLRAKRQQRVKRKKRNAKKSVPKKKKCLSASNTEATGASSRGAMACDLSVGGVGCFPARFKRKSIGF